MSKVGRRMSKGRQSSLDEMINNLKFDAMEVNTELAQAYIEENKAEFHSLPETAYTKIESGKHELDKYSNKIYCVEQSKAMYSITSLVKREESDEEMMVLLRKLANTIKDNSDLFCQLEYLIRGIPVDDVKTNDIELMIHNLLYFSATCKLKKFTYYALVMDKNSSLSLLALVAQVLISRRNVYYIISYKETAVVCYLFTKLCYEVGIKYIELILIHDDVVAEDILQQFIKCTEMFTTGVVAERADIDSATRSFLNATCQYQWSLQNVLVQENIFDAFKRSLAGSVGAKRVEVDDELRAKCADAYSNGKKTFLMEYTGEPEMLEKLRKESKHCRAFITLEAYRNNEELVQLLKTRNVKAASLWCADSSETQSLIHNLSLPFLWLNSDITFRGPPKVSQALYYRPWNKMVDLNEELAELIERRKSWLRKDYATRRQIMSKTIDRFVQNNVDSASVGFVNKFRDKIGNWHQDSFVLIENGMMCFGVDHPIGLLQLPCMTSPIICYIDVIKSIVDGNGVLVIECLYRDLFEEFQKAGMPVIMAQISLETKKPSVTLVLPETLYQTKVVWTNFGTGIC